MFLPKFITLLFALAFATCYVVASSSDPRPHPGTPLTKRDLAETPELDSLNELKLKGVTRAVITLKALKLLLKKTSSFKGINRIFKKFEKLKRIPLNMTIGELLEVAGLINVKDKLERYSGIKKRNLESL
ncbi:hypothetical protein K7432_004646 [Basidiobolus ranarum]|uniref:Uncharacterized protein n=1 Tax=Basidiobolus ranarum TaxID=34480 RepID=A0ABR2WY14_9FUNG